MTDQCKHCQLRGDLKACMAIECSKHKDWYPQQLQQQNDKLTADNAALVEALEAIVIITNMGSVASMKDVNGIAKSALDKAKGDV